MVSKITKINKTQSTLKTTPKMVKRTKINRTQSTLRTRFSLIPDPTHSGALVSSKDNLLTEILRRLPVTSILRFKSVSKRWHSLLSHRHFTLLYDNVPFSLGLFLRNLYIPFDAKNPTPPPFPSLNFNSDRCGIEIMQSCNGLLLCCSNKGKEDTRKYYVFNPTTNQFAVIPSIIGGLYASKTIRFMGLAFHKTDCVHYKVICFRKVKPNRNMFQIQIYSSNIGKWRISHDLSYIRSFGDGVYWNGALHWISNGIKLVYFKLDVEQLHTMLLPDKTYWSRKGARHYLGESGGHLHFVDDENPLDIIVYELLSDYSGWFVKYRVELDELQNAYPFTVYCLQGPVKHEFEVVDVVSVEEEEESTFVVMRVREKIIMFNVHNRSFKQIFDLPCYYRRLCTTKFHRYTQMISSF